MSTISQIAGPAVGEFIAWTIALSLFFTMTNTMTTTMNSHAISVQQKNGYQTCMRKASEEYCSTIYPE